MSSVIRLALICDHTNGLLSALNFAQGDGPLAPFLYDKLMHVQSDWEDLLKTKQFSPRIEEAMKKIPSTAPSLRKKLLGVISSMLDALKARFKKEAKQLEFLRQLRVLNPQNLSDMETTLTEYPMLGLGDVPGIKEEWDLYRRTEFRDISVPDALLKWWQGRHASDFKEAVLFLITVPSTTGSVERFFSQAGNINKKQNKLSDEQRRLALMARFNLDVEERLV